MIATMIPLLTTSLLLLVCLSSTSNHGLGRSSNLVAHAFPTTIYHQRHPIRTTTNTNTITSTSRFAGGGFGASKSKSSSSKKKKGKNTKSDLLDYVQPSSQPSSSNSGSSQTSTAPKLDRFGLPLPTEDTIFPPLDSSIIRTPITITTTATNDNDGNKNSNREEIANAIKDHLGVNLSSSAFDFNDDNNDDDENNENEGESSTSSKSPKWKLNMLHKDPPVFTIDDFFTKEECAEYISMAEPSSSTNNNEQSKAVRITSPTFSSHSISRRTSTTWFCQYDGVPTLLAKARELLGTTTPTNNVNGNDTPTNVNGNTPNNHKVDLDQMEEPQIVRYRTGEEFSWHYDEIPKAQLENGGQRLATLLVYLNELEEGRGGGTVFRDLMPPKSSGGGGDSGGDDGKKKKRSKRNNTGAVKSSTTDRQQLTVRPKTGTALLFFPSYKDGTPDIRTLHKGEVALDKKMIAQLWIHEGSYRAGVPVGNLQGDAVVGVRREEERLGFL